MNCRITCATLCIALCLPMAIAHAESYDLKEHTPAVNQAIAQRTARYATLEVHKHAGYVGEGLHGQVEQRGGGHDVGTIVQAENRDRATIYQAIVTQNGLPAEAIETVRQVFGEEQRDRAKPGQLIQQPNGSWSKKQ
jgi:uncharacterized protein